jgi:hypothetical protein
MPSSRFSFFPLEDVPSSRFFLGDVPSPISRVLYSTLKSITMIVFVKQQYTLNSVDITNEDL